RDHHQVVLILTPAALPLGGQHADDAQREALHENGRAQRILVGAEELLGDGVADEHDERRRLLVGVGQGAPLGDGPVRDGHVLRRDALHVGGPVLALVLDLAELAHHVAHALHRGCLAGNGAGVVDGEGRGAAVAAGPTSGLVPRFSISFSTAALAPWPTATMAISAATPMNTPSVVSTERSLLREIACAAAARIMRANDHDATMRTEPRWSARAGAGNRGLTAAAAPGASGTTGSLRARRPSRIVTMRSV